MNPIRDNRRRRYFQPLEIIGFTACTWALLFAVVHIYWAVGGEIGLYGNEMTGFLLVINLIAIPLCFLAAISAIGLTASWNRITPHRIWVIGACGAATLLSIRGIIGISQYTFQSGSFSLLLLGYDMWFFLGGILFSLLAILSLQRDRFDYINE